VVGWANLTGVGEGTPGEIWDEYGAAAAIEGPDFGTYSAELSRHTPSSSMPSSPLPSEYP